MYFAWNIVSYLLLCCTSIALTSKREEHLVGMFGDTLYKWSPTVDGNEKIAQVITVEALRINKTLGIYFSGSWCGPCQAFTPKLVDYYTLLMKKSKDFEVVWISHDHTSDDFVTYFQQMPWLAMTAERVAVEGHRLAAKFKVQGLPSLVLMDATDPYSQCTIITAQGVEKVSLDPYALEFPYKPRLHGITTAMKTLVPRRLRSFLSRKKDDSMSAITTTKSTVKDVMMRASPSNLLRFVLGLLRNIAYRFLALIFPRSMSSAQTRTARSDL